jgi:DNA repair exonuclease SbcCD ATPase subunit
MRRLFLLLLMSLMVRPAFSQTPQKDMSKQEMQHQIADAIKELNNQIADLEKQLAEAKKNKDDAETIKDLEDQLKMLRKQVDMMGGLNKNVSKMSEKTIQQASEEEPIVPPKDVTRINSLPKKVLTEAELSLFIKNVHAGVEKIIPAIERTEALNIYNETKSKYKSLGKSSFHYGKSLYR